MRSGHLSLLLFALTLTLVASCASQDGPQRGSAVPPDLPGDAIPKKEPRSRYGNPPVYEVLGQQYTVMDSSYGYRERGVASWYGKKFHGRQTSSQEPYDMYAMTAAHKTLPLPTYVRVRNLRNNKTVVVRVNDRGPFISNRIIDLSYSAAARLSMIQDGTSLVEVTALSYDSPPTSKDTPTRVQINSQPQQLDVFVQVGAFGDVDNARRRYTLVKNNGISNAFVHMDNSQASTLYRIRIGPIDDVTEYDNLITQLGNIGITESHLVTE